MRLTAAMVCAAALCGAALYAQSSERVTKSKITIEHGADVTVIGCVERTDGPTGFILTKVTDRYGALRNYTLVPDDTHDLAKHVGHFVRIKGTAADRGDAKVKIETRTEIDGHHGDDETHGKTTMKGDLPQVDYLGVRDVKLLSGRCPQ